MSGAGGEEGKLALAHAVLQVLADLEQRTVFLGGLHGVFALPSGNFEFSASGVHPREGLSLLLGLHWNIHIRRRLPLRNEAIILLQFPHILLRESLDYLREVLCNFIMVGDLLALEEADAA